MAKNLVKPKDGMWKARLVIPAECRPFFEGRCEFIESTGTHDLRLAQRKRDLILPAWRAKIDAARAKLDPGKW